MKLKFFWLFLLICAFLGCSTGTGSKQAKIYKNDLGTMIGKEKKEVINMVNGWNFGVLDSWEAENPGADTIKEHNRPVCGFSRKEIQEIFASKGKYDVMILQKKVGTDSVTTGHIDQFGQDVIKDTEYNLEYFTLIRTVFRDGNLISFKVWPSVTNRSISGTKLIRR